MAEGSDEDQEDKTYEPTPQKLEKAREKGDIAQSKELHALALYLGVLIVSFFAGSWSVEYIGEHLYLFFTNAPQLIVSENKVSLTYAVGDMLKHILIGLLPFIAGLMVFPLFSMIAQQSITFAPDKIAPKLSRISLIQGFKNKFGRDALVEFAKGVVKVILVGIAVGTIAIPMIEQSPALIGADQRSFAMILGQVWIDVLIAVTIIAAVIGAFDFFWQKYSFMQRMMMSFQDIKDEMKESQGDPHFKGQRQQRGREIAMGQMMAEVPNADVVIVNPTHYAIALKWDQAAGRAPVCIAKGIDDIALAIKAKAAEHDIPIRPDPPLARTLHASIDIGDEILEEHYRAVAAAIRFAQEQRKKQKNKIYS